MTGRLENKVVLITGAVLAKEGADIIGIDICRHIDSNAYSLAIPENLSS